MLMHHSKEDYRVAAEKAAAWARPKMEAIIQEGRQNVGEVAKQIQRLQLQDAVVKNDDLTFGVEGKRLCVSHPKTDVLMPFHRHALTQMADKIKLPSANRTIQWLSDPDIIEKSADILNTKFAKLPEQKRFLLRSVDDEVRGFLSSKYRRLNSGVLMEAFISAVQKYDTVPMRGRMLDTKFYLKVVKPTIYEPIPNELCLFGTEFKHSDFGDGKLVCRGFVHRLGCTNLMMTDTGFNEVHLGKELPEDIEFSEKTYELDTQARASAMKDIVANVLEEKYIHEKMDHIRALAQENVDADSIFEGLVSKKKITKGEKEQIREIYRSADTEILPPGDTAWRLSNALSAFAQKVDPERELELEILAGEVAGLQEVRKAA
jgi:hypothetical protein